MATETQEPYNEAIRNFRQIPHIMFVVKRSPHNPLLVPTKENLWESMACFNWCPVADGDVIRVVYRAMGTPELVRDGPNTLSTIGLCDSRDGLHFSRRHQFIKPTEPWDKYGCEDPRITKFEGKFYIFYTALSTFPFNAEGIKAAVAITKDFKKIEEKHLVTPFNAKAMTLFPERINGKIVAMLSVNTDTPPAKVAMAYFDQIEEIWSPEYWGAWYKNLDNHAFDLRRSGNDQIEVGAPPIKTPRGWLVIYSHIQNYFGGDGRKVFGIEAILLDINDPTKIIGRTKGPFLVPEEIFEEYGLVPSIVFPSGAIVRGDKLDIYYGASDTTSAKATVDLESFLDSLTPNTADKKIERYSGNPILSPKLENAFETKAVFNAGAIDLEGKIHLLYRAMSTDNTSVFGLATTKNGFDIDWRSSTPVYTPREAFERKIKPGVGSGCEDPRIVRIGQKLYVTYTAYDGEHLPAVAVTSIKVDDFLAKKWDWEKPIIITPAEVDDKDSCLFPEKVAGKYLILHRIKDTICADYLRTLNFKEEKITKCIEVMKPRPGMWDGRKIGIAAPPIKTKKGWLLFYHGISERTTYRLGVVLLDLKNPTMVIARTTNAILSPEMKYEVEGEVQKVVFPCGIVLRDNTLFIYYGAADKVLAVATMKLPELLKALAPD